MEETKKCPKCSGEMEFGYKVYPTHIGYHPAKWVLNLKEKKQMGAFIGHDITNGINIICYRCKSCGYLENYAE